MEPSPIDHQCVYIHDEKTGVRKKLINKQVVPDVTNELLKNCNIVREKRIGTKQLFSRTGKVCGAKDGASYVNEPLMR